jgi:hypothetical protein
MADNENFLEKLERNARTFMRGANRRMPGPTIPDRMTSGRKVLGLDPSNKRTAPAPSKPLKKWTKEEHLKAERDMRGERTEGKQGTDSSGEFKRRLAFENGNKLYMAKKDEIKTLKPKTKKPVKMPRATPVTGSGEMYPRT